MSKAKKAIAAVAAVVLLAVVAWLLFSGRKNDVVVTGNTSTPSVQHQPLAQADAERLQVALNGTDKQQQWEVLWQGTADAYRQAQAPVVSPGANIVFVKETFVAQGNYAQVEAEAEGLANKPRLRVHLIRDNADQPWKILRMEAK